MHVHNLKPAPPHTSISVYFYLVEKEQVQIVAASANTEAFVSLYKQPTSNTITKHVAACVSCPEPPELQLMSAVKFLSVTDHDPNLALYLSIVYTVYGVDVWL